MARAGFYAIQNSEIRFGRDGRWYADGQPIANARIADLFSQHVQRRPDGGYMLRIAADDVLYCRVKQNSEPARFLRAAYYQIAQHIGRASSGGFVFQLPGGE